MGDVVRVAKTFSPDDASVPPVILHKGLRGTVRIIDGDGDAIIRFPCLTSVDAVDHFVFKEHVHNLEVLESLEHEDCKGRWNEDDESDDHSIDDGSDQALRPSQLFPEPLHSTRACPTMGHRTTS